MKNGKKICWNYRKGRCRFGSNCTYAHDSDLHTNEKTIEIDKEITTATSTIVPIVTNVNTATATAAATIGKLKSKTSNKKRPGLSDSIIPSKKVIKAYNALKK